jgi:hypothetical protein
VNEQVPPAAGGMLGTGTCVALIAIGSILRFALSAGSPHGLNVHVVGVIVIGAGVLGLLLSLLVWGPLNPARRRRAASAATLRPPVAAEQRRVYQDERPL